MKPLSILLLLTATLASAQGPAGRLLERLNNMTPEQRRRALERMPADRRQMLENRISNLNKVTPEARERLRKDFDHFQQLPPEKQEEARKVLRQIADLPEDRRRQVRGAVNHLRQQGSDVQQERVSSKAFAKRFTTDELRLIRSALSLLPPPETQPAVPVQN